MQKAKIALIFDWMTNRGGAEKLNLLLHRMFPDSDIFTSIFNYEVFPEFDRKKIHTSFIQNLPFAKNRHQLYLSLMPYAYELFDLSQYDIVISSCHATSKGVITKPETMHICYCHTPMRYAWDDWHNYIDQYRMNPILKRLGKRKIHKLRMWDRLAADRVDYFIANSTITRHRIQKYYNKPASVIFPAIDTNSYTISKKHGNYFLAAGRLIPYKKFDLIVDTFNELGLPLKIIGTGNMERDLRAKAKENIEFLGFVDEQELAKLYSDCLALIFPQLEDFGMTAVEVMASGRPVIALKSGGALDYINENKTGIFIKKQTKNELKKAIKKFDERRRHFQSSKIKQHAESFSEEEFEKKFLSYLETKWKHWKEMQRT